MDNIIFNIYNKKNNEINNDYNFDLNNLNIQEDYEQKVDTLLNGIIDSNLNKKIDKLK